MATPRKHLPATKPLTHSIPVLLAVAFLGLGAVWWLSSSGTRTPAATTPTAPATRLPAVQLQNQEQAHAAYGGSASCKECHEEAYELWANSHHGLAERLPHPDEEDAAFVPARTFPHGTQETTARKTNDTYELLAVGLHGTNEVYRVERIIANYPLRQLLISFPGGRLQATEACWDPRSNEWFNVYGEEDRQPGEWGHWTGRGMNWNNMCATCHNTRLRKNYDLATDTYHTAMVERGVGCESCHGPMKDHNEWQYANKGKGLTDPTIRKLTRDQMFDTCAACHSRRGEITGDPKPGDSFFDHHLLTIVDESDIFYPDGQVWGEDYEVAPFLASRMYHKDVRCVDCHDFHSAKTRLPGNLLCMSCHAPGQTNAPVINPVTHSFHKVFGYDTNGVMTQFDLMAYQGKDIKETGGECVNCHMPQTVYMQRHWRHDHGFTIPDPLLTKQFGIPNACNRCHQDKSVDWALEYVEKWYGDKMERPYRWRAQAVARARNGDDAAREPLLQMLRTDEIAYWRAVAANLLERWVAEPAVTRALIERLSDTNALVRQNIIQTLAALGEPASAELRAALSRQLEDPVRNVRVVAAQTLASSLDTNSLAGAELLHMLAHNADQPTGQLQLGIFAFARGNSSNALHHFETAAKWDPFSPAIRHELAVLLSQLNRPREALREMQEAVRLAPDNAEFRFKLALAWNELGESVRVRHELETAVKLDPQHARAWYNLGLARHAAGDSDGAVTALLRAESAEPRDPRIPYARATIHAQLGQREDARRAARRALELEPRYTEAEALLRQLQ